MEMLSFTNKELATQELVSTSTPQLLMGLT